MTQKKQHNDFVVSISARNIDTTIVNIEEMIGYNRNRNRSACVVTEKQTYGELEPMNFQLVMNYSKPKVRTVVNTKGRPFIEVYDYLLDKYKSGLIIAEADTISEDIAELICSSPNLEKNDIDIIICRDSIASMSECEMRKANYLRISADPDLNAMIFQSPLIGKIYQDKVMTLMISQFFVNFQLDSIKAYLDKANKAYEGKGLTDYVNYYELNKQLAYFLYVDIEKNKILNISRENLIAFLNESIKSGIPIVPAQHVNNLAEMITNY